MPFHLSAKKCRTTSSNATLLRGWELKCTFSLLLASSHSLDLKNAGKGKWGLFRIHFTSFYTFDCIAKVTIYTVSNSDSPTIANALTSNISLREEFV
jgi:hypothetical protein